MKAISQRFRCNDGNAEVYFFEETIQIGHTFLTIRQDEDGIANVKMTRSFTKDNE